MSYVDTNNDGVLITPEKCTGCLNCQLICSFALKGVFNPSQARILVDPGNGKQISFAEDCILCNLCVSHCVYGTLSLKEKE